MKKIIPAVAFLALLLVAATLFQVEPPTNFPENLFLPFISWDSCAETVHSLTINPASWCDFHQYCESNAVARIVVSPPPWQIDTEDVRVFLSGEEMPVIWVHNFAAFSGGGYVFFQAPWDTQYGELVEVEMKFPDGCVTRGSADFIDTDYWPADVQ
jgi:hypothetical protein